jgi:sulfur carrier protein
MLLKINGKPAEIPEETSLLNLIELKNIPSKILILELNGNIIQREKWQDTRLNSGDKLEIIRIIGGG